MSETLVNPSELRPDPNQPRKVFNEEEIEALAESYKTQGIIVPIEVDENNVIILGERRWRAAKKAGVKVPIRRKTNLTQKERLERQLTDDAHRSELSTQEKVWAYATGVVNINEKANYDIDQVKKMDKDVLSATLRIKSGKRVGDEKSGILALSEHIGVPERTIATYLSYFKVGPELQTAFDDGRIQLVYLYEVSKLSDLPEEQARLEKLVLENKFRRRDDIREYIDELRRKRGETIVEAVKEVIPAPAPEVSLETPEEFEEAAKVLRKRAKAMKTPEQILEEKREKARKALLSGGSSVLSKIEYAEKLGIEVTEFEVRLGNLKTKIVGDPDAVLKETKKLRADVDRTVKAFKQEEMRQRLEEELREKVEKEVEERTVRKMLSTPEFIEAAKTIPTRVVEPEPEEVMIPPEDIDVIKMRYDEVKRKLDEIIELPDVRARGKLFRNWHGHYILAQGLPNAFCPVHGERSGRLVWSCCGLSAKDALKITGDEFEKSQKKK